MPRFSCTRITVATAIFCLAVWHLWGECRAGSPVLPVSSQGRAAGSLGKQASALGQQASALGQQASALGQQASALGPNGSGSTSALAAADASRMQRGDFPPLVVDDDVPQAGDPEPSENGLVAPLVTTASALLVVLAVFGVFVFVSRRFGNSRPVIGGVPDDVVQHLGSTPLDAKTRVMFLKIGQRLLVIAQTQSGDPQTLSEITDPDEVERLTQRLLGRPEIVGKRSPSRARMVDPRSEFAAG